MLDSRLLPGQDSNEFVEQLRQIIDDPQVEIPYRGRSAQSIVSLFDTELFKIIEKETKEIFPHSIAVPSLVIYGTDSRYFRRKGAICYGFFPGPLSMEEYGTIHGNGRTDQRREPAHCNPYLS